MVPKDRLETARSTRTPIQACFFCHKILFYFVMKLMVLVYCGSGQCARLAAACCWLRATKLTMSSTLFQRMYTGHLPRWSPTLPHATLSIGPAPFHGWSLEEPSSPLLSIHCRYHCLTPCIWAGLLLPPVIGRLPFPCSSFPVSSASIAASWLRATNELLRKIFSDERADLRAKHLW